MWQEKLFDIKIQGLFLEKVLGSAKQMF